MWKEDGVERKKLVIIGGKLECDCFVSLTFVLGKQI